MPYYSVSNGGQGTLSGTYKGTVATWTVTTGLRRIKWYEVIIGATGSPTSTDTAFQIDISRLTYTSLIAGTTGTMTPLDPADGVAITTGLTSISTEANANSIGVSLMNFGLNQRNTTRWIAAQESQYLISPATNLQGLYMRALSTGATYTSSLATAVSLME